MSTGPYLLFRKVGGDDSEFVACLRHHSDIVAPEGAVKDLTEDHGIETEATAVIITCPDGEVYYVFNSKHLEVKGPYHLVPGDDEPDSISDMDGEFGNA